MPTYSYECTECGNRFDIVQAFTDDALTTCEQCSGRLRKRFNSVGIVFKGSGFYRTDSRESAKAKTGGSSGSNGSTESSKNGSSDNSGSNTQKSGSGSGPAEKSTTTSSTPSPAAASS